MVRSTVGTLGVFAGMGLGLTATKHVAEYRRTDRERAGRIIRLCATVALFSCAVLGAVLVATAPFIASRLLSNDRLVLPLVFGAALLVVGAYDGAQKGTLAGFEAYREIAWVSGIGHTIANSISEWVGSPSWLPIAVATADRRHCLTSPA